MLFLSSFTISSAQKINYSRHILVKTKGQYRENVQTLFSPNNSGKLAQRIRGLRAYRESRQIFVSPVPFLSQVRINTLLDGKELVMPGPSLKQGFFLLKPFSAPFPKLSAAVSLTGISQYGSIIPTVDIARLKIGMFITEALLVNTKGIRLGDGTGYFDLAVAIIHEYGGVAENPEVWAVLADGSQMVIDDLPSDPWDIPVQGVATHAECHELSKEVLCSPKVHWEHLALKTIKKIDPLWKLSCDVLKDHQS